MSSRRSHWPGAAGAALVVAVGALGCDAAPLAGKGCPCAAGYTCCAAEQLCLSDGQICANAFAWPPSMTPTTPLPLDAVVFAMSEYPVGMADPRVLELAPDVVVRGWSTWDTDGFSAGEYDTAYLAACHQANIRFIGGASLSALFEDQFPDPWDSADRFLDFATRDGRDGLVSHDQDIYPKLYWATLANPRVRARAVQIAEMQIDLGVDGVQFVGLDDDLDGFQYDGNEGYDDYRLADFNAYLLAKYPTETETDLATRFSMTPPNVLRRDLPPGDLTGNFNYRTYLHDLGVSDDPSSVNNPLAGEWGTAATGRATTDPQSFLDTAGTYVYWRQIVDEVHAYAQARGLDVLVNATGVYPFVDFQTVGLYDNPIDAPGGGGTATYVPVTGDGHLDGTVSLAPAFAGIKARAQALSPAAPVVVFLDGDWSQYDALTAGELQDYWRLYTAEAYANGLFFAFDLYSPGDPQHTAPGIGLMPLYQSLAAFYRAHAGLYRGVVSSTGQSSAPPGATVTLADQPDPADSSRISRRIVHLVNHQYAGGIVTRTGVPLTISSSVAPIAVTLASPDQTADAPLSFSYADGQIALSLPSLAFYDVVVISY